jgi:hypothetical protein
MRRWRLSSAPGLSRGPISGGDILFKIFDVMNLLNLRKSYLALIVACLAALAIPIITSSVFPLIDFYNHISRYYVLSNTPKYNYINSNYEIIWRVVPNIGLDIIGYFASNFFQYIAVSKFILFIVIFNNFAATIFLNFQLSKKISLFPIILSSWLSYSYILTWGFTNFLFGIGCAFWGAGIWLKYRDRILIATVLSTLIALIVFLIHGLAFAFYGLLVAALEFGIWRQGSRSVGVLIRGWAALAFSGATSAAWFLLTPTSSGGAGLGVVRKLSSHFGQGSLEERLYSEAIHRLTTVVRVSESPYALLDYFTFAGLTCLLFFGLRQGLIKVNSIAMPALFLFGLLVFLTPPTLFGVGFISDRVPLAFAMVLIAAIGIGDKASMPHWLSYGLVIMAALKIVAVTVGWSTYAQDYTDFQKLMTGYPKGALLVDMAATPWKRDADQRRCEMFRPLALPINQAVVPLFANATQQPLSLDGDLKAAVKALPAPDKRWAAHEYQKLRFGQILRAGTFRFVLICDGVPLALPLPVGVTSVRRIGRFQLVQLATPNR